jgi:hypothetical protein
MRDVTKEALARLEQSELFKHVGEPVDDDKIVQVASLQDAIKLHRSLWWEYIRVETMNKLTSLLHYEYIERYRIWNQLVDECAPIKNTCIDKALNIHIKHNNRMEIRNEVSWNIFHGLMEIEYSDLVPTGLFYMIYEWHCKGHYPCGFMDRYPEGKLIIY